MLVGVPRALALPARSPDSERAMDIDKLRADTPGCAPRVPLNHAGPAPPPAPAPVMREVREHLEVEFEIGGYEAADARADAIDEAYRSVAALIGADAHNIAFTESATTSYAQALTSIPFERGDVILTTRNDYVSNQLQFLSLESRLGVRVRRAPDAAEGGVDVGAVERIVRESPPKVVCVTHVPTNTGL